MKKLLLLLVSTFLSFGSMAMGFPHNIHEQQRSLSKNIKQKNLVIELEKSIQVNLKNIEIVEEDIKPQQESLIEMLTNYVVSFFSEKVFGRKLAK